MKYLIFPILLIFLAGCNGQNILSLFEDSTPEKKAEAAIELTKHQQELEAAHKLDHMAAGCVIVIGCGVGLVVFGLRKIGISIIVGGAASLGALQYWQLAQQLVLKYSGWTYFFGICLIILLICGIVYALFVPNKGAAIIREGSWLDKIIKKIKGENK